MMTNQTENKKLTNEESYLLKKIILSSPDRPGNYTFSDLYRFYDYEKHSSSDIKKVVLSLVEKGYLEKDEVAYTLSRDVFLTLKKQHKKLILINSEYGKLIIPVLIAIVGGVISLFHNLISSENLDSDKVKVVQKLDSLTEKIHSDSSYYSKVASDSGTFSMELTALKNNYSQLSMSLNAIHRLLQDNPTKFIEIATLKRDIEDLKKETANNNESLKRDIDRISSYNNTLIVFMITFLVAYIGLGIFNFINRSKN